MDRKVVKFPQRTRHQVWLELETADINGVVYPNGISMSLDPTIQEQIVRTIPGLENVDIVRPGYSVEYDHVDPRSLTSHLCVHERYVGNDSLYLAGQLNGTTGYEEAAAQGIVAGANAALSSLPADESPPLVIDRTQGFIGVMIDDLTTSGVTEPYRMFSSRSEYRLTLRAENADLRLTEAVGVTHGLVSKHGQRATRARKRKDDVNMYVERLKAATLTTSEWYKCGVDIVRDGKYVSASDIVGRRKMLDDGRQCTLEDVETILFQKGSLSSEEEMDARARKSVEVVCTYAPYLERQAREIKSWRKHGDMSLRNFDFSTLEGLIKTEELEKLIEHSPETVNAAARVSGVNASTVVMLVARQRKIVQNTQNSSQ